MREVEEEVRRNSDIENIPEILMAIKDDRKLDARRYNIARDNEVAVIFENSDGEPPYNRYLIIHLGEGERKTQRIYILNPNLDSMVYPLLFPFGEQGWHIGMPLQLNEMENENVFGEDFNERDEEENVAYSGRKKQINISQMQYYCYQLSVRDTFCPIFFAVD